MGFTVAHATSHAFTVRRGITYRPPELVTDLGIGLGSLAPGIVLDLQDGLGLVLGATVTDSGNGLGTITTLAA